MDDAAEEAMLLEAAEQRCLRGHDLPCRVALLLFGELRRLRTEVERLKEGPEETDPYIRRVMEEEGIVLTPHPIATSGRGRIGETRTRELLTVDLSEEDETDWRARQALDEERWERQNG